MFNVKKFNNKLEYIKENLDHSDYKKIRNMERYFVVRYIDTDSVYLNCLSRFLETISIKNDRPIKLNSIDLSIIRFINPEKDKMSIKIYTSSSGYVDADPFLLDSEYRYGYRSGIDLMSYLDKYISCIDKKSDNKPVEPCLSSIEVSNSKQKSQETSSETNNSILNNSNSEIMTTRENKAAKTVKGGMNGMMNKMMETMKSRFMPELVEGVKVSFDGLLCIHTKDGWIASNNNNELVSYPDEMVFEGFPVYSITRQIDQLMIGDIIVSGKGYSKVLGATKDGKLKTLSYSGYNRTEVPIKDFIFGKSVKVLMNMLPQMKAMGFDPMMMGMMNGELDFESLMMFQVMGGRGMNFGGDSNPMSMMAIMSMMGSKDEGEDKGGIAGMMEMMMMSSMFGGGGANPFGAMFGGGANPNVNANPNPQEGMANAFANMMGGFTGEGGIPVFQKANVPVAGDEPKAGPKVIATFDPEDENEDQK